MYLSQYLFMLKKILSESESLSLSLIIYVMRGGELQESNITAANQLIDKSDQLHGFLMWSNHQFVWSKPREFQRLCSEQNVIYLNHALDRTEWNQLTNNGVVDMIFVMETIIIINKLL